MRKVTLVAALVAAFIIGHSTTSAAHATDYVSKYLNIASYESARGGIPVSIILAQGILESNSGDGDLAKRANNHFGIKWKNPNDGAFVLANDDDKDARGKTIPSRFVKYRSVEESFKHHTDFIVTRSNYQSLLAYDRTDYTQWALGLSRCGYATDPQYANKLISIIEKYNLAQYDIPSVLSLDDEDDNAEVATENYTGTTTELNNEELFEISTNKVSEARSEMWEAKNPVRAQNNDDDNQLFEIVPTNKKPEVSKNLQSKIQQPKSATKSVAKDKNN